MQIHEAIKLEEGLEALAKEDIDISTRYAIGKNLEEIQRGLKTFKTEQLRIFQEFGERREGTDGSYYAIKEDNKEEASAQLSVLLKQEEEIKLRKIKVTDIIGVKIKQEIVNMILPVLEE